MRFDSSWRDTALWRLLSDLSTFWWVVCFVIGVIGALVTFLEGAPVIVVILAGAAVFALLGLGGMSVSWLLSKYSARTPAGVRLSAACMAELTRLMVDLDTIIASMRREVDLGRVEGATSQERSEMSGANLRRLDEWVTTSRAWVEKCYPAAVRILSLGADAQRGVDHASLPLAEHYRRNFDRIFSDVTGTRFTPPSAEPAGLDLAISCDEVVIGGVGIMTTPGAPPGPTWPGTYLVASRFYVTNRAIDHGVVLSVTLRVKMRDGWREARFRGLDHPASPLDPRAFSAHHDFVLVLSEPPLQHPINLGPTQGTSGRVTFYLGFDAAEHADDLRTCEMEWQIHDSVSGLPPQTYPVVRTRNQWRVLLSRLHNGITGGEPPPWLSIESGELVLVPAPQASVGVVLGGENIDSGIYVVIQNTRLTNHSSSPVALVPTLWRRLGDIERRYPAAGLPATVSRAPIAYGQIIRYLGGAFESVVNLGPLMADAKRLVFRMPFGANSSDRSAVRKRFEDLQQSEFEIEMHDTLSERRIRKPIKKTGESWRVDS